MSSGSPACVCIFLLLTTWSEKQTRGLVPGEDIPFILEYLTIAGIARVDVYGKRNLKKWVERKCPSSIVMLSKLTKCRNCWALFLNTCWEAVIKSPWEVIYKRMFPQEKRVLDYLTFYKYRSSSKTKTWWCPLF